MPSSSLLVSVVAALGGIAPIQALRAQAHTADAEVSPMIFRAFPEADAFRQIPRDVDLAARLAIEGRLPFKVHFNELGAHTLFVAFRGVRPVGLIYRRSEESEWGLTDVAWAMTLDLRVHGFWFLSGRSPHMGQIEQSRFASLLAGSDCDRVLELVRDEARAIEAAPDGAEELARIVLRSAAKAMIVTDTVWREQVELVFDTAAGYDAFPSAARFPRHTGEFELSIGDERQTIAVRVVQARTSVNTLLGSVIRTEAKHGSQTIVLTWVVDPELRVLRVTSPHGSENASLRHARHEMAGHRLSTPPTQANQLAQLALGLDAVLVRLKSRGRP
jgi:hypothetical protein